MSDVNISYKGTSIATMDASGTKTLQTSGKYCEGDITVSYTKPAGEVVACQIIEFTLATHSSANVTIGTLSDEAYSHIDDDNFCVAMINTTLDRVVAYDDYRLLACNAQNAPAQGNYPIYGCGNRKTGATAVQNQPCYYKPNDTTNATGIGGLGKFWHSGKTLYYKSASYYLGAGTYRVVITW